MKCRVGMPTNFSGCGGGEISYSTEGEAESEEELPGSGRVEYTPTNSVADNSAYGGINPPLRNPGEGVGLPCDIP